MLLYIQGLLSPGAGKITSQGKFFWCRFFLNKGSFIAMFKHLFFYRQYNFYLINPQETHFHAATEI
jgi:hypothetical protein